jgi:hypothetical protein
MRLVQQQAHEKRVLFHDKREKGIRRIRKKRAAPAQFPNYRPLGNNQVWRSLRRFAVTDPAWRIELSLHMFTGRLMTLG